MPIPLKSPEGYSKIKIDFLYKPDTQIATMITEALESLVTFLNFTIAFDNF